MGYNDGGIRVIGAHPRHPALLYNLGCNGVGFLPSIYGGQRIARLLAGEPLAAEHLRPALGGPGYWSSFASAISIAVARSEPAMPRGSLPLGQ